jgi:hypothetical protein
MGGSRTAKSLDRKKGHQDRGRQRSKDPLNRIWKRQIESGWFPKAKRTKCALKNPRPSSPPPSPPPLALPHTPNWISGGVGGGGSQRPRPVSRCAATPRRQRAPCPQQFAVGVSQVLARCRQLDAGRRRALSEPGQTYQPEEAKKEPQGARVWQNAPLSLLGRLPDCLLLWGRRGKPLAQRGRSFLVPTKQPYALAAALWLAQQN